MLYWALTGLPMRFDFATYSNIHISADKLLVSILNPINPHLNLLIFYFGVGTCTNHLFDYILWHYYWHEEYEYITRTGKHVIPFWV